MRYFLKDWSKYKFVFISILPLYEMYFYIDLYNLSGSLSFWHTAKFNVIQKQFLIYKSIPMDPYIINYNLKIVFEMKKLY